MNGDAGAQVNLVKYTPKTLTYTASSRTGGVLVFSEIYYPHGWKVEMDGKKANHFRADYTLRAMYVPAGNHKIKFTFDPESVKIGDSIAMGFIAIMYLTILAGFVVLALNLFKRFKAAKAERK